MRYSIFSEVTSRNALQAYFDPRDVNEQDKFYFTDFFPWRYVQSLQYETLFQKGTNPVVADVVTYDSSAPEKTRKVLKKLTGDIPAIRVKRIMNEVKINDYNTMKAALGDKKGKELLDFIFYDVDSPFSFVQSP